MSSTQAQINELSLDEKAKNLLSYANENRKSGSFNDFNIQVGNQRFPCNKMVLSCYSTYFERMFRTEMQERYRGTVELEGFDKDIIKMLLDYMYGEKISINDETVLSVLAASDYLQLQDVKEFCIEYLTNSLTTNKCFNALTAYNLYMPNETPDHIYQFIGLHFDEVWKQENFYILSADIATALFTYLGKNKVNQDTLFSAICKWIDHDQENRKDCFASLFKLVDLSQLSAGFIEDSVVTNPLVAQSTNCLQSVVKALTHKLKQPELQPSASMNGDDSKILCLGGEEKSSVMEVFSIAGKINSCYPDLPTTLRWHCVEKVDDFVYCMGGVAGDGMGNSTERVYRMNLKDRNKTWSMIAGMSERRCFHATAVFRGNIVVSGGIDLSPSRSSEMYHINGNKWTSLKPMNEKRSCHSMVVCNDTLYALGGFDQRSVEKLEDVEGNWTVGQPMNVPRSHLATVCLNGKIYAIGGSSKQSGQYKAQKSVEKFVPKESRWSYVSSMNTARERHAACVLRGKIYVVGGIDEDGNSVSTIECYDPDKDTWSIAADNICELYEHAVVAI